MLKPLIRHGLPFVNVGSLLRWRARLRRTRDQVFMWCGELSWTYAETWREALRWAHLLARARDERIARGRLAPSAPLAVGLYQENTPEFVFLTFGAALIGATVFGINTGFRGETLRNLIERAELNLLIADADRLEHVAAVLPELRTLGEADVLAVGEAPPAGAAGSGYRSLDDALEAAVGARGSAELPVPPGRVDNTAPFLVIYTSGTTGAPKGVSVGQFLLVAIGVVVSRRLGLRPGDRGYVCMPLFHSNAWYLGIMPLLLRGGSFVLAPRFSASGFEGDVLRYGVTYLNYVGQPIHYILHALETKYGSGEAVQAALARHPRNRLRIAHGNGATPLDREKLVRYLGMEHIYELYGSTEAAINTFVKPGDPPDSVGEITSRRVVILDDDGRECPPGRLDVRGRLLNYDSAVGEICKRMGRSNLAFAGYFKSDAATDKKYRGGYYHSGDLGHVCLFGGKRYLYFDGRTDDWIRKDGENFSAENVTPHALAHPAVRLAVAYGVPAEVADEKVMVAVQLEPGATLDGPELFTHFLERQRDAGMDPKWMPDYVREVPAFDMTETQKIRVRPLKQRHFKPDGERERVFYRQRGDEAYHPLTAEAYAELARAFEENGRRHLIERD